MIDRISDIDFVITWVDGGDPAWRQQKQEYLGVSRGGRDLDTRDVRYRPWDTLRYLFRGIDSFAPWVRKVHFVTCGHLPPWLDTNNPKLNIVKHVDYIPEKYLPTFSSRTIDFNFHRIPGLSEQFVNFDDDMMIIGSVEPSDFFINGLPCDSAALRPSGVVAGDWHYASVTNSAVINKYFKPREVIAANPFKWFNPKYGKSVFRTLEMLSYRDFYGIGLRHLPYSFLKKTFEELWEREPQLLDTTCSHRGRVPTDPNKWLFQDWQLVTGCFCPRKKSIGAYFCITGEAAARDSAAYIGAGKGKLVCLNDVCRGDSSSDSLNPGAAERIVAEALDDLLPERSSFELDIPRGTDKR